MQFKTLVLTVIIRPKYEFDISICIKKHDGNAYHTDNNKQKFRDKHYLLESGTHCGNEDYYLFSCCRFNIIQEHQIKIISAKWQTNI